MKKGEEAMEILEASDATGSLRAAAALAGCDHKTVARLVAARDVAGGGLPERARQRPLVDPFAAKIDEQVDRSRALVRADVVHGVLVAMGYAGSYRTTRRAVAKAKRRWRNRHGRRTRPWIPQPGLWLQWDYGDGPEVAGVRAVVLCAWLAWSRFRVVVPLRDKTLPSVVIGLDRTLRAVDGVPTYALTDNKKTVTVDHVCGIAVRNATIVEASRHYGLTIQTCEPADLARGRLRAVHGGCEHAAASRDPPATGDTARAAARASSPAAAVAPHAVLRAKPKVDRQATVAVGDAIYSVPHELIGERVWVRADGEQLVTMHIDQQHGPREVARHRLTTPGRPSIQDGHYPPRPAGALERKPRARNSEEREFLAIRDGAKRWLERAAAEGTARIRRKMAEAIDLAKLHGIGPVNEALERCASYGRFADGDLASILAHQQSATVIALPTRAPEDSSLQRSTRSLGGIRTMNAPNPTLAVETDALSGDLRPCETLPRPIPYPPSTRSGGSGAGDDRQAARPTTVPDELDRVLRRLPMPYVRRAAPEVVATAVAQRWEHAEALRILPPRRPPAATKRRSRCAATRLGYRPARRSTHGSLSNQTAAPRCVRTYAGDTMASSSSPRALLSRAASSFRSGRLRCTASPTRAAAGRAARGPTTATASRTAQAGRHRGSRPSGPGPAPNRGRARRSSGHPDRPR